MDIHKIAEEIKERLDIVDVISQYLKDLKKRGKNYIALCPFHSEKTPSFTVSREKQIFYCFGCNTGGDVIKFVSLYENITYIEAIKKLALKAGVDTKGLDLSDITNSQDKEKILIKKINYEVAMIYSKYLKSIEGKRALSILKERGFKEEVIEKFNIGYAPDSYDLIYRELSKKYSVELLLKSQVITSSSGKLMDSFRNRIIIPIRSISGDIIGFGARAINEEDQPKYLNSSETPVFSKRKVLFGLYDAIGEMRREKKAIIVEGYMDVMMMHQYRFFITISPLGTSFTYDQARMIKNYVDEVILMFDSDSAGINASLKAGDILVEAGIYPRIALLPANLDPDEYLLDKGIDEMLGIINNAKDIIDFKIHLVKSKAGEFNPEEKLKIVEFMGQTLIKQGNEIIRNEWIKKISQTFSIPEISIKNYLNKGFLKTKEQILLSTELSSEPTIENNFVEMLILKPELINHAGDFEIEWLESDFSKKIFDFLKRQNEKVNYEILIERFPEYKNRIMKIIISSSNKEEVLSESNFRKTLMIIMKNYYNREWKRLKNKIPSLTDEEWKRFNDLTIKLKNLNL